MQVSYKLESLQSTAKNRKRCLKLPSACYLSLPRKSASSPARKTHHRITAVSDLPKPANAVLTARYPTKGKNWQQEKVKTTKYRKFQVTSPASFFIMKHKKRKKSKKGQRINQLLKRKILHKQNHTAPSFDVLQMNKEIKDGPCNLPPLAQLLLHAFTLTDKQVIQS